MHSMSKLACGSQILFSKSLSVLPVNFLKKPDRVLKKPEKQLSKKLQKGDKSRDKPEKISSLRLQKVLTSKRKRSSLSKLFLLKALTSKKKVSIIGVLLKKLQIFKLLPLHKSVIFQNFRRLKKTDSTKNQPTRRGQKYQIWLGKTALATLVPMS